MNNKKYPDTVVKELKHLELLSRKRSVENRLNAISDILGQWKAEKFTEMHALQKITELTEIHEKQWSEGADIGIPIAKALNDGTLTRDDFSDKTWKAIEVLVDLLSL